jgi:hypothetical protein
VASVCCDSIRFIKAHIIVALVAFIVMFLLVVSETYLFISPAYNTRLRVDDEIHGKLLIAFNITFPELPCILISVNAFDKSGINCTFMTRTHA